MREFTEDELIKCNGKNGNSIYIAYKGRVYDVSSSFLWEGGRHQVLHDAGVDLTNALEQAPHNEGLLEKFPVVGVLKVTGTSN